MLALACLWSAHGDCVHFAWIRLVSEILLISRDHAARPCQRCIKRGMADNCTEGHRKKAKYLLDEEELGACAKTWTLLSTAVLIVRSRGPETD